MKLKSGLCVLCMGVIAGFASLADAEDGVSYRLRAGDHIAISVWGEDTLNLKDIVVLPDGTVTFPLVGTVSVAGLSASEASALVADKLKSYLPEPQVTVIVSGNLAYVIGKVAKPGPVLLQSPLTAMQALSLAGAMDKFADTDEIKVIRRAADGAQQVFDLHYDSLIHGRRLEANIVLQPGDTIVVP
jgi:polysaccharide biosynthesis/export protein